MTTEKFDQVVKLFQNGNIEIAAKILNEIPKQKDKNLEKRRKVLLCAIAIRSNNSSWAIEEIERIIKEFGQDLELANLKGVALRNILKLKEAFEWLKESHSKFPESIDIAHNLSVTATDLGMLDYAIEIGEKSLIMNPKFIEAYKNLGRVYVTRRDGENSRRVFSKLNEFQPNTVDVMVGMGAISLIDDDPIEAARYFEKAIEISPQNGPAWGNLGLCYKMIGLYQKAKESLVRAAEVDPQQVEHPWNLSLVELAMGDFKNGWKRYEVRFDPSRIATDRVVQPQSKVPRLLKENSVKEKTIVLLQEQGFGDTFQFFRYAKNLKDEGAAKIIAINSKELINEIKTVPWIDEVYFELMDTQTQLDYWVYPMSLPDRYDLDSLDKVPCPIPYAGVYEDKYQYWHQELRHLDSKKLKVGLVWAGRETHTNDKNRSMNLGQFESLKKFENDIEFISLQKGKRELDAVSNGWKIERLGQKIQDFADSAGVLANLDLLISIDSAPVHLGGAMGMPVWALIPQMFDFRWMIDKTDTPWYPSVRLFRQEESRNWAPVIAQVEVALREFVESKKKRWTPHVVRLEPKYLANPSAGANLWLQAAFDHHQKGELQAALTLYEEVKKYNPINSDAIRNMAVIYRSSNQIAKALELYEYGVNCELKDSIFYSNYANLLNQLGKDREAIEQANKALEYDKNNSHAIGIRANYLFESRQWPQAMEEVKRALQIIQRPEFLMKAVLISLELKDIVGAQGYLNRLLVLTGETLEYHLLAGNLYKDLQRYDEGLKHYAKALEISPKHYETYMNRAVLKAHMQDYLGAEEDAKQSIALDPNNAESHFNLALYLLAQGKFSEGWKEYEWRMDSARTAQERVRVPVLSMPMWDGQSLIDKTILIMPEQGYGDFIQFIRYAKWLKELGAKVIAATTPALEKIIQSCPWVDEIALDGQQVNYHYWTFPMSLPFQAKTTLETIPANTPYLSASEDKKNQWLEKMRSIGLKKSKKPLIALCWQGAAIHRFDHRRSVPLELFGAILKIKEFEFIGLVREEGVASSFIIGDCNLINLGADIADFSDTAAILSQVDLLISIDSAPVHLAGAMGVPCWVLLDSMFDFRWLIDREDSPWYSSVALLRKTINQDWSSVIRGLEKKLLDWKNKR
jgi:tetratricopeptide (TPR) repeat protein